MVERSCVSLYSRSDILYGGSERTRVQSEDTRTTEVKAKCHTNAKKTTLIGLLIGLRALLLYYFSVSCLSTAKTWGKEG
jgi:hypothetical protein